MAWVRVPPNATPFLFFLSAPGYSLSNWVVALWLAPSSLQWGCRQRSRIYTHWSLQLPETSAHTKSSLGRAFHAKPTKKGYGGTGIRARVKRITTAYANHYTIPPRWQTSGIVEMKKGPLGGPQVQMALFLDEGPPRSAIQLL